MPKKKPKTNFASIPEPRRVVLLDAFTAADIDRWAHDSVAAQRCLNAMHFDLERQRVNRYHDLRAAVQAIDTISVPLDGWVRVVDYQWGLKPLSSAGSVRGIGGRFNYGRELSVMRGQDFPCLYLASDFDTAQRERFGAPIETVIGGLKIHEYALRSNTSFVTFALRGQVDHVFDLRTSANLKPFVDIISKFNLSQATFDLFKKSKQRPPHLVRTVNGLMRWLLASPSNWRQTPNAFGVPHACQIFGWFLKEAGVEAVIYNSQQGGSLCLAVFPQNFPGTSSHVEVVGPFPPGADCTRLDRNNLCLS